MLKLKLKRPIEQRHQRKAEKKRRKRNPQRAVTRGKQSPATTRRVDWTAVTHPRIGQTGAPR
ncbi:hypothetical protein RRF57_011241 [Xylaria bambusicola]|uniref:Uncharacterized protein n=1 Tax=Xylaria bambusicola TaxID=326684 RepID=A0AAN7UMI1_9PEZI